ncbi:MAG: winged helix-turn-helix domain-containing protein [Bifidobacteriaceae bacterium]|jgi:predicted nucleotidyltransferase|nr:winged helix-turn-helix domain-containing protein [Bifidobacteriaceae bacterium]
MKTSRPEIAPYLRSDALGRILAAILLAGSPDQPLSVVAEASNTPLSTVQREVDRLVGAGVVTARKLGPARLVSANERYPLLGPLRQIIAATYGPARAVADAFEGLAGLERLVLFGSWAARMAGVPGPFPADVDVLVVGSATQLDAIGRAIDAGERIGREVNASVVSPQRWAAASDGFVADVKSKPFIELEVGAP